MAPRLTSQMCFLLKSNTRWTQDEERSRVTGHLNTKKTQLYQRTRLIGEYTQSGRREEQSEGEGGKGGKNKKRRVGRRKLGGAVWGPCSHLSPIMKMGEGPLQYPTPLPWGTLHTPLVSLETPNKQGRHPWSVQTLAGYANNFPKIIIIHLWYDGSSIIIKKYANYVNASLHLDAPQEMEISWPRAPSLD